MPSAVARKVVIADLKKLVAGIGVDDMGKRLAVMAGWAASSELRRGHALTFAAQQRDVGGGTLRYKPIRGGTGR